MGTAGEEIVRLESVTKTYAGKKALEEVTLRCPKNAFTAIVGPPGAGKTTLLRCAAGLDRPTSGWVAVEGADLTTMDEAALDVLRRERISYVFSSRNLLPALTVAENLTLPLRLAKRSAAPGRVVELVRRAGLSDHLDSMPADLCRSRQQMVAVTRAMISGPAVIFADDPARGLDPRGAGEVLELLASYVHEGRGNVVMASHDPMAAAYADRAVLLKDGRVVRELTLAEDKAVMERAVHLAVWEARDPF
ncbi:ATP-binding cassette domain-containing protein [Nonomuraea muscovyensis]